MIFKVQNETGASITIDGTTYANNAYVDLVPYIAFGGLKFTRNDVDGANAGRALNGVMIRDRVATKGKWEVSLLNMIESTVAEGIYKLVYPESFHIQTDLPNGSETRYNVYTNNIPISVALKREDGTVYYTGMSIPFVEI